MTKEMMRLVRRCLVVMVVVVLTSLALSHTEAAPPVSYTITNVKTTPSAYVICGRRGRALGSLPRKKGELMGFSDGFYILKTAVSYDLYRATARKYKSLPVDSVGEVCSVWSDFFTARKDGWMVTYDSDGTRVSARRIAED